MKSDNAKTAINTIWKGKTTIGVETLIIARLIQTISGGAEEKLAKTHKAVFLLSTILEKKTTTIISKIQMKKRNYLQM
jgi:hypothetical protein